MPSRFAAVTNKEISQLITKKVTKVGVEVLTGKTLTFDLNLSIKPAKNFFVYKCKLSLSFALLYLVELFINKRKTKFNNLFYKMILNTKRIHNSFSGNFPARAKQMPSKVLFVGRKKELLRPFGHFAPKL